MAVEFDESVSSPSRGVKNRPPSFIVKSVLATGVAKTEQGARAVLFVGALIVIGIALFLYIQSSAPPPAPNPTDYAEWPH